jgi:hypothetical protein
MKNPLILEINTWIWLSELTLRYDQAITLSNVPSEEWDEIQSQGFDHIWLLGVWKRSPAGLQIALQHSGIIDDCQHALPGCTAADMIGSSFSIQDYTVDEMLGGHEGIVKAYNELHSRGMKLVLDFVPNHVAPDHVWTVDHPEYFILGTEDDLHRRPDDFLRIDQKIIARARDPYYPPWPDVVQVNAFSQQLRDAYKLILHEMTAFCDGVRCDMAMLVTNRIFEKTWGESAGEVNENEFWTEIIADIKKAHHDFIFLAEVYWDMEWELQQQGFDFCYDKKLYDRLVQGSAESIRQHVSAGRSYQEKLLRFIENHDEPRVASLMEPARHRAAAVMFSTLTGARLFHHGQSEGRTIRIPVFLSRSTREPVDFGLKEFYQNLTRLTSQSLFHEGEWVLCSVNGWPDNDTCRNLLAWSWSAAEHRALIVINYSGQSAQGMVSWPWNEDPQVTLLLEDALHHITYERSGHDLNEYGLFADLQPWDCHFLIF